MRSTNTTRPSAADPNFNFQSFRGMARAHLEEGVRVLFVGNDGTGKSSIVRRLSGQRIDPTGNAPKMESHRINVEVDEHVSNFCFVRAPEDVAALKNLIGSTVLVILIYDITNRDSFERLSLWWDILKPEFHAYDPLVAVLGNKLDLAASRQIPRQEAFDFALRNQAIAFGEISSLNGEGMTDFSRELFRNFFQKFPSCLSKDGNPSCPTVNLNKGTIGAIHPKSVDKGGCCTIS